MKPHRRLLLILAVICSTTANANGNNWIDALSLSYGEDSDNNDVKIYRVGLQNKWERTWMNDGAWYIGGYWDAELGYMESDNDYSENDELFDLGLTPVFRMQRDASLSSGVSPYAEFGIGPHLISETRLGNRQFSTAFQFGSLFGLGLGFGDKGQYELSYRYQHISNASIKTPNNGMNLHMLRLGYTFQ
ncbi:MAG: acyloxyacyl hydrolase [Gammaproteobacteria bacterium]|nr:acyloxyacyl hydrolase [Gammaproteobacteria bacterium]